LRAVSALTLEGNELEPGVDLGTLHSEVLSL
jgi:hypothetical protein